MDISEIKQRLTLATVLNYYSLKPDKNLRLHCPFHDDKTPSMQVYYKTHTCYCFSANCKAHGKSIDVIDFIMYKEGVAKHQAILKAQELLGGGNRATTTNIVSSKPNRSAILQYMFTYFKNAVHNSKPAQEYIKQRGLDATKISIGYNTGQFYHGTRKDKRLIQQCLSVGLLSPWGTSTTGEQAYQAFAKYCICFPLRDKQHQISGLYFRNAVPTKDSHQKARHFYLKESSGLYPSYPNLETERLIIAESIIDTASLLQIEAISKSYSLLAAYGTNRLNDEMKTAIKAWSLSGVANKEIIFAFDNDDAGGAATAKYAKELTELLPNIVVSKLVLPCKDVNETLIAHQPDIFLHLLENRIPIILSNGNEAKFTQREAKEQTLTLSNEKVNARCLITQCSADLNTSNPNKITYTTATASYAILGGLPKQLDMLKVMLMVVNKQGFKSRNKVDLYEDKQVEKLCKEVSEKLQIRKDLMEQDIYKLTEQVEAFRETEQGEHKADGELQPTPHFFTLKERIDLESFLKKPKVIERLNDLLGKTGIVGEACNRIFLLLIAVSYKMKDPLHALVQGSSGSGKTKIVRQISDCIPQESVTRFTRISDKALYNYPKNYFTNRLVIIEDVDGLSEEAELAFRELQSSGELRSSVSIKLENGSITGGEKVVSGPIASMSCTTKGEVYEDNMSRVFLIAVDESIAQTQRIIAYQNAMAAGRIDRQEQKKASTFVQNLIRIIAAKEVVNPFAERIQLPESAHKIRRLNDLFQNFIKMVTLMNQYQRQQTAEGKLIAEIEDIETAIEIMFESIVLKVDELDGSLRQFYEQLKSFIAQKGKGYEFNRFEVRAATGLGKTQQHHYLTRLTALEYIQQSGFANRGFRYKIVHWDNYKTIRDSIKNDLKVQIEAIKMNVRHSPTEY